MQAKFTKGELCCTRWSYKTLAFYAVPVYADVSCDPSFYAAMRESNIVHKDVSCTAFDKGDTSTVCTGSRVEVPLRVLYRVSLDFAFERLLTGFLDYLAGSDVNSLSLIVPVCCSVDRFELRQCGAVFINQNKRWEWLHSIHMDCVNG